MAVQIKASTNQARLQAISDAILAGGEPYLALYTGSPPGTTASAATGTLLVTLVMTSPTFSAPTTTQLANSGSWTASITASGLAGYWRVYDGLDVCQAQGTCGTGTGDLPLNDANLVSGKVLIVSSFIINSANQ